MAAPMARSGLRFLRQRSTATSNPFFTTSKRNLSASAHDDACKIPILLDRPLGLGFLLLRFRSFDWLIKFSIFPFLYLLIRWDREMGEDNVRWNRELHGPCYLQYLQGSPSPRRTAGSFMLYFFFLFFLFKLFCLWYWVCKSINFFGRLTRICTFVTRSSHGVCIYYCYYY